jgi:amino acid transporter
MNRTPLVLSLLGLALLLFGVYMILRFATLPLSQMGLSDNPNAVDTAAVLRHEAGPGVLGTYFALAAAGLVMFGTGLAMMLGRSRLN